MDSRNICFSSVYFVYSVLPMLFVYSVFFVYSAHSMFLFGTSFLCFLRISCFYFVFSGQLQASSPGNLLSLERIVVGEKSR